MQDPDDDFLADVAALGLADRAILDARFERDRVGVHVDAEQRQAGFDPQRVPGVGGDVVRAGAEQPGDDVGDALGGAIDVEARTRQGVAAGDEHRRVLELDVDVRVLGEPGEGGDRHVERLADDRGRGRPVDAEAGDARRDVLDDHVLGDDELLEAGGDGRPGHRRHVQQQRLARGQDPQVADHPALRRQVGGIAALAGLQAPRRRW